MRIVQDNQLYLREDPISKTPGYPDFKSFFEASLKQPFEQWAELEATYNFVSANCPELLERSYKEARAAAVQRLAVEVESEPLGKHGGLYNPSGSNQYQRVGGGQVDIINLTTDDAEQEAASTETLISIEHAEFDKDGNIRERKAKKVKGGTSEVYLTRRIARDHPIVYERMKQGKYRSVRAAAVDAGIFTKRISVPDDPVKAAISLDKRFKEQNRILLIEDPAKTAIALWRFVSDLRSRTCLKTLSDGTFSAPAIARSTFVLNEPAAPRGRVETRHNPDEIEEACL